MITQVATQGEALGEVPEGTHAGLREEMRALAILPQGSGVGAVVAHTGGQEGIELGIAIEVEEPLDARSQDCLVRGPGALLGAANRAEPFERPRAIGKVIAQAQNHIGLHAAQRAPGLRARRPVDAHRAHAGAEIEAPIILVFVAPRHLAVIALDHHRAARLGFLSNRHAGSSQHPNGH